MLKIKRVYEPWSYEDGYRVLVDKYWPRGLTKKAAHTDYWMKELAPSDALRKWFGHDPAKWEAFERRYFRELWKAPYAVYALLDLLRQGEVTLVYSAKDTSHNHAVALRKFMLELVCQLKRSRHKTRRAVDSKRKTLHSV